MKRIFTLKDKTSDKFWTITTDGVKLTTNYGKIRNTALSSDRSSSFRGYQWPTGDITQRIGEGGQVAEKTFGDDALCTKEAEKQIAKKIKEGYAEQEKLFIDLDEGMQLFQDKKLDEDCKGPQSGNPGKIKILHAALDELDKRDSLAITYGVHIFIQYIEIAIGYATNWLRKIDFDNIKRFLYSVPKFKTENADILDGITVLYAEGFFIALHTNDAKLEKFCLDHLDESEAFDRMLIAVCRQEHKDDMRQLFLYKNYLRYFESKPFAAKLIEYQNQFKNDPAAALKNIVDLYIEIWEEHNSMGSNLLVHYKEVTDSNIQLPGVRFEDMVNSIRSWVYKYGNDELLTYIKEKKSRMTSGLEYLIEHKK